MLKRTLNVKILKEILAIPKCKDSSIATNCIYQKNIPVHQLVFSNGVNFKNCSIEGYNINFVKE